MAGQRTRHARVGLVRGAVAGLVAGAVFIGFEMWFATSLGEPAQAPLEMISLVASTAGIEPRGLTPASTGWIIHGLLSAGFGATFSFFATHLRTSGQIITSGALYGLLLYALNFLVLVPVLFTQLSAANQPFNLLAHILFGIVLGWSLFGPRGWRAPRPALTDVPATRGPVRAV